MQNQLATENIVSENEASSQVFGSTSSSRPMVMRTISPRSNSLAPQLISALSTFTARPKKVLPTHDPRINEFLEGGLPFGSLCEWGAPFGRGGREILCRFIAAATQSQQWSVWVNTKNRMSIYAPAWAARGVDFEYFRVAHSSRPMTELKPLLLDPFFRVIVLDAPCNLTDDDSALLARQARQNDQLIILVRDYLLSPKRGNVWAKIRVNCWQEQMAERFCLQSVRGLSPRQCSFAPQEIEPPSPVEFALN